MQFLHSIVALATLLWTFPSAFAAAADPLRLDDGRCRIGVSSTDGTLCELTATADHFNQLADTTAPWALWQITVGDGTAWREISAERAGPPKIERLPGAQPGLRLVWDSASGADATPLRVEVVIRLIAAPAPLSRWELSIVKPQDLRVRSVHFPRVGSLRERPQETLAVPRVTGILSHEPRKLLQGKNNKGLRLSWEYPFPLTLQCLAFYQEGGPGFYAACDDAQGYRKKFEMAGDGRGKLHFEAVHEPEQQAAGLAEFRLPFAVLLGSFHGDWSTAARIYRESPAAQAIAAQGRLRRKLTPDWVSQTGLWLWNRNRSPQVLTPATVMREHLQTPVSVLWHWWHNCPYDAGFPEYLPPREGTEPFKAALATARQHDVHAILYMNQRLWGTQTQSWTSEGAEAYAVKDSQGKVHAEVYNTFMKAPCAPMCIATKFWRDKYAGLAQAAFCDLKADGVYMDQVGCQATCYDARHGHIPGPGRYWTDGLAMLTTEIRDRCTRRGPIALGGEFCGEPWIGNIDLLLGLDVAPDRISAAQVWEPMPFYQAVYHGSTVMFGNMAGLAHPPYDEKWPQELCPPGRLALLDRKFARQFCLEHARTFVWGMQPMLANFLPVHLQECPEELDFVTRLVRTRMQSLKYLLHGTWIHAPALDVPREELDVAQIGTYTPLKASKRTYSVALAGAWHAADGDVGLALASIYDQPLKLSLPIDAKAYGLKSACSVYRLDANGRKLLGRFDPAQPTLALELPPRGLCVVEFCVCGKP